MPPAQPTFLWEDDQDSSVITSKVWEKRGLDKNDPRSHWIYAKQTMIYMRIKGVIMDCEELLNTAHKMSDEMIIKTIEFQIPALEEANKGSKDLYKSEKDIKYKHCTDLLHGIIFQYKNVEKDYEKDKTLKMIKITIPFLKQIQETINSITNFKPKRKAA